MTNARVFHNNEIHNNERTPERGGGNSLIQIHTAATLVTII